MKAFLNCTPALVD